MRKIIVFTVACFLFLCSFLLIVQPAGAALYSGAWEPNSDDAFVIQVPDWNSSTWERALDPDDKFGLYSWENGNKLEVLTDSIYSETITFNKDGGSWTMKANSAPIDLGSSNMFGFYFWDASGGSQGQGEELVSYELTDDGADQYLLDFGGDPTGLIEVHDANPVPIPTAMLLFGSGLLGLAGFRRRRQGS